MGYTRAVWILAALLCCAAEAKAQQAPVTSDAPHAVPSGLVADLRLAPDTSPGTEGWSLMRSVPSPRPLLGEEQFAGEAASTRGGARRGVIIGALVGAVAAGAFSYHLREETGRSPFPELAVPMAAGAVAGGLLGGLVGALLDRDGS